MIDEYNLYNKNDDFIGTYTVFRIAELFKIEPEKVEMIYEHGGKFKGYRIAKILRQYEKKPKAKGDIFEEWRTVTAELRRYCRKKEFSN